MIRRSGLSPAEARQSKRMRHNDYLAELYIGRPCTLDGRPAFVRGRLLGFARIVTDTACVEFAWPTVGFVMEHNGGRFTSCRFTS